MQYDTITSEFKEEFLKLAEEAKDIVITAHKGVDDDAIASSLSVYDFLITRFPNKNIQVMFTGEYLDHFKVFKYYDKVKFLPDLIDGFDSTDLLIVLDGSQFGRFTDKPEELKKKVKKTICIDHHSSPIEKFDLSLVDSKSSSAVEIIYLTLFKNEEILPHLAEIFLLGILGDTGNFLYLKSHQTQTLTIAKKLIEIGNIEIQEFQSRYRTISKRVFTLIQKFISNTQYHQSEGWPNYQTSYISKKEKELEGYTDNEVSEASHIYISHYLRLITNYSWGFVITPKDNETFGISLRSLLGSVSVRDMMERLDMGGGHDRASGGTFKKESTYGKCFQLIHEWIHENKPLKQ